MIFEAQGALHQLEAFCSHHGADFYQVPRNTETVMLAHESWEVPTALSYLPDQPLIPLYAGQSLPWKIIHGK